MSNERVVCVSCGSNNFATQAACWKCGKPLSAAPVSAPVGATPSAPVAAPSVPYRTSDLPTESPAALWSSVALGLLFPMISIPVGLVFLMLDNKRKSQIGWWNILFGLLGTLLNGILVAISLTPLLMSVSKLLPGLSPTRSAASQDPNAEVPPLDLPGQRPFFNNPPR